MDEQQADYEVGYGRPPKETQFARGRSGNPRGRPKGSKNLATLVLKESRQPVRINGPSGVRTVSKLQAAIMQLGNKSAQGDLRASREFLTLVQRSEESAAAGSRTEGVQEADQRTMQNLLRRMSLLAPENKMEE